MADTNQTLESKEDPQAKPLTRSLTRTLVHKLTAAAQPSQQQQQPEEPGDAGQDQNYQFYKEYCRLYYANIILTNRLQQLLNEKQELQFKLNRLEVGASR